MKKYLIFIFLIFSISIFSQEFKSYYYSPNEENVLMIRVNVWGYVNNPTSALLPDGTDLITAISYAGGPKENANLNRVVIIHSDGSRQICDLAKFKNENSREHNPILKPGDTVRVGGDFIYHLTRYLRDIYNVAVIANTVFILYTYISK
ncbi:MAG: Soluble ligand binding domain-containing protein [candidate division TA06 bacterium 32_111]|uniref:Soluble ligand binding domain-containing protein n=1 Tax=candidate division TA06 bacterium 34_109 TaxID=1635277 RepID=A0A101I036_UNCT6|nr:MAG: Soluble ligand binding domain-containing protein [candidate division TA06 bacterium 32_111]KUK86153.1 MAG: Soluble ligand binding domain-containing protein [candidate division TA06 bacterium 34_109]HCP17103.1 hypothetical protein [candidate division WOR-3 bacterium]